MQQDHDKIRQRAYEIWDRDGRPEGRAQDYWLQAERELGAAQASVPAGLKNDAGVPAQAKKRGDGATKSAPVKAPETGPRKRRGSQPVSQS
jgi:Protein of unknown function (DUF2934)